MKRFWLVLLSLVLIAAFSTMAFAVDVKVSGEFFVGGMYLDKTTLKSGTATDGPSTALYFQRLRMQTDFVVSPGLSVVTRFDVMERAWGAARTTPGTVADNRSMGTTAENENIAFDNLYVRYASPIGNFTAGYTQHSTFGTIFGNSNYPAARITYSVPIGAWIFSAVLVKATDKSVTAKNPISGTNTGYADADSDSYYLSSTYKWKSGQAGLLYYYVRSATARPGADGYQAQYFNLTPYIIFKLGPVSVQSEVQYDWGKSKKYDSGVGDVNLSNWMGWIDATATFGPVYFGGTFAYIAGDDPNTTDKIEGGVLNGGWDWNPCLILWNYDRWYWAGPLNGQGTAVNSSPMSNAFFYQGRVGAKPNAKLDIMASVSYASADRKPTGYQSDAYGWEADIVGTYKITNNLSYMLGFGYLFTGDYFKGNTTGQLKDDYMVINKLTLTF